ncbi:unnamed protein product [Urochloa decumbens]|uniref:Vps72/YL1 C-terminal domain-containing protein n=2 Tax=Urochloa decumbens TaxID=240449 RepID=A0ABC9CGK4_9POAL
MKWHSRRLSKVKATGTTWYKTMISDIGNTKFDKFSKWLSVMHIGEYSSMELEVVKAEMVLAPTLPFKKVQTADKYPKGQSRGRQWKHLRHLLHAADAFSMPPDRPNYLNIQSPPSIYPTKRYCDITGFEAPYADPRTKLRYADPEVFKQIRMLPDEYVQRYLALRNAAVVLR